MGQTLISNDRISDHCPYELDAFMEKHSRSKEAAEVILHMNGPSGHRCDHAAAAYLKFKQIKEARRKPPAP